MVRLESDREWWRAGGRRCRGSAVLARRRTPKHQWWISIFCSLRWSHHQATENHSQRRKVSHKPPSHNHTVKQQTNSNIKFILSQNRTVCKSVMNIISWLTYVNYLEGNSCRVIGFGVVKPRFELSVQGSPNCFSCKFCYFLHNRRSRQVESRFPVKSLLMNIIRKDS